MKTSSPRPRPALLRRVAAERRRWSALAPAERQAVLDALFGSRPVNNQEPLPSTIAAVSIFGIAKAPT